MARSLVDFTRRMLYFANRSNQRMDFLRDLSRLLVEQAPCDTIGIRARDENLYYHWEASFYPEERFRMVNVPYSVVDGRVVHTVTKVTPFEEICNAMVTNSLLQTPGYFTKNGGLLIANADLPFPATFFSNGETRTKTVNLSGRHGCIAFVPFNVDEYECLAVFMAKRADSFDLRRVEYFEVLANTVGLAAAEHRAKGRLRERLKELTCLYRLSHIADDTDLTLDEFLQRAVSVLPSAWQYSQSAYARISLDDKTFTSSNFVEGGPSQAADILINGTPRGRVSVHYDPSLPQHVENLFLPEEEKLISVVAAEISDNIERFFAHEEKKKLWEQLKHAERLSTIGQFAAGVAHQLNEPLGAILGYAQLIKKQQNLSHDIEKDLSKIVNASLAARETVRKLLTFAREMPARMQMSDVNTIIEDAMQLVNPRLSKTDVVVSSNLGVNLPLLYCDASQIQQVVINLIVNAVQAMPDGGRLVITTRECSGELVLSVEDSGIGMSEDVQAKMFLPFYTTKEIGKGTGLGLPVVHGIVAMHGGRIEVKSEVGHGSRFDIILPVKKVES